MELAQTFLTFSFYIVWYGFCLLFIFDFLLGLPPLMAAVQLKSRQQAGLQFSLNTCENICEELPEVTPVSESNFEEATRQYLETVGADIKDFESVVEARKFLDENAKWTIETVPIQPKSQLLPDPWFEPFEELSQVVSKPVRFEPLPALKLLAPSRLQEQAVKLTFEQVQGDFAQLGLQFQKHRTGHYRYRVSVNGLYHRFKTLQDALDWLVSKRLIKAAAHRC